VETSISSTGFGRAGEGLVADLLENEGWVLLDRNFKAGRGEIDIIAEREGIIAFIEVKRWRKAGCMDLARSVGRDKKRRIIETSKIFLSKYRKYRDSRIRYDVIFLFRDGVPMRYEGAFDETL